MGESVIQLEDVGKKYTISHEVGSARSIRDAITQTTRKLVARENSPSKEEFWALKNISFAINQGEAVGIVGRNGAGKSTLLKILSRITEPTEGRIVINGRVASLLEVGTGFHPELTGRENVFLNGAILGMGRAEIKRKFDEIIDFAGIEKFLDTPVKRYSSGMYVRLAFAVAAHLEPEILIVDEVLAVGDVEFQKKCLGKMNEVSRKDGRTVIFVSHNLEAIRALCPKAVLLQNGLLTGFGNSNDVVDQYLASHKKVEVFTVTNRNKPLYFNNVFMNEPLVRHGSSIHVGCEIMSTMNTNYTVGVGIINGYDRVIGTTFVHCNDKLAIGSNTISVKVPLHNLVPAEYKCILAVAIGTSLTPEDIVTGFPSFTVVADENGLEKFARWTPAWGDHILTDVEVSSAGK